MQVYMCEYFMRKGVCIEGVVMIRFGYKKRSMTIISPVLHFQIRFTYKCYCVACRP